MKHFLLAFLFLFTLTTSYNSTRPAFEASAAVYAAETNWPGPQDPFNVQVFPNPVTTYFGITETEGVERIVIFNLTGRKMKLFDNIEEDKTYYVGDLPRSMYLVQILGADNKILTTRRISKR